MLTPEQQAVHEHLHSILRRLPSDFEPYGQRSRDDGGPDCSCGCRHFQPLQVLPSDWGVCTHPDSPRCGLLTFEHQGCAQFEEGTILDEEP